MNKRLRTDWVARAQAARRHQRSRVNGSLEREAEERVINMTLTEAAEDAARVWDTGPAKSADEEIEERRTKR